MMWRTYSKCFRIIQKCVVIYFRKIFFSILSFFYIISIRKVKDNKLCAWINVIYRFENDVNLLKTSFKKY